MLLAKSNVKFKVKSVIVDYRKQGSTFSCPPALDPRGSCTMNKSCARCILTENQTHRSKCASIQVRHLQEMGTFTTTGTC